MLFIFHLLWEQVLLFSSFKAIISAWTSTALWSFSFYSSFTSFAFLMVLAPLGSTFTVILLFKLSHSTARKTRSYHWNLGSSEVSGIPATGFSRARISLHVERITFFLFVLCWQKEKPCKSNTVKQTYDGFGCVTPLCMRIRGWNLPVLIASRQQSACWFIITHKVAWKPEFLIHL